MELHDVVSLEKQLLIGVGKKVNRNMDYAIAMKQLGRNKSVLKSHRNGKNKD